MEEPGSRRNQAGTEAQEERRASTTTGAEIGTSFRVIGSGERGEIEAGFKSRSGAACKTWCMSR